MPTIRAVDSETGDLSHWWTVFNDPVLNSLVQTAYRQNLTLKDAGYRVLQARAQLGIARGGLFPQTQAMNGDLLSPGDQPQLGQSQLRRHSASTTSGTYGFTLSWELDFWGRFRRTIESAGNSMNASVENYDAVLVTLLGDVATAYVQIRTLAARRSSSPRQNVLLAAGDAGAGRGPLPAAATPRTWTSNRPARIVNQTAAQVPALEISLRMANNQLCVLLGIPPDDLQLLLGPGAIPDGAAGRGGRGAGRPVAAPARRAQAEYAAAAQSAQIGVAESDFYPHISIVGTLDYQSQNLRQADHSRARSRERSARTTRGTSSTTSAS